MRNERVGCLLREAIHGLVMSGGGMCSGPDDKARVTKRADYDSGD